MPSSSSHRHKRPCQPNITEFFPLASPTHTPGQNVLSSVTNTQTQWPAPRPLAPLPAYIQSSLMNVGMRIRKAVPEGYKTYEPDKTHKPSQYWSRQIRSNASAQSTRQRELVPYCAINNVGNLETENKNEAGLRDEDLPDLLFPGDDEFDTPFSSQESGTSIVDSFSIPDATASATDVSHGKKRVWEDLEEGCRGADDMGLNASHFCGQLLSSDPIAQWSAIPMRLRPLAQPRSKKKNTALKRQGPVGGMQAAAKSRGGSTAEDFEEADFFPAENWIGEEMEF